MRTPATLSVSNDLLDPTRDALLSADVHAGIAHLRFALRDLRASLPADEWRLVGEQIRRHPVHDLLLESPFTHRAYTKPRGYAGDAALMDLIYGLPPDANTLSALGGMLYAYEFDSPCFQSVRTRRAILARELDAVAAARPGARVLSVACGHLREVEWSVAVRERRLSIVAVDQDDESLAFVRTRYGSHGIAAVRATVGDLLRRSLRVGDVDLAYAAGLYDYLDQNLAQALTAALFRMLAPSGRLLIANFTPATRDAAFMEAVMDWHLVYRSPDSVHALTAALPAHEVATIERFSDESGLIAYLRVTKR